MPSDLRAFSLHNIADSCSVWNVLSSGLLYARARECGVRFYCTQYVIYECLHKKRSVVTDSEQEMKRRLSAAQSNNDFAQLGITVEDLRAITTLEARKKLGKGELSSIVFAKKASQAFMTDDKKARVLSGEEIGISLTQTTPHLVGWLVFTYKLNDSEIALIKNQHREMKRPLSNHFDTVHLRGLHFRISVGNPT